MTRDVIKLTYSGNIIVNSGYSLNLNNAAFVLDAGVNIDADGNSNSTGSGLSLNANSFSCSGSAVSGLTLTATVECDGDVLTGSVGGAHITVPMTVSTVFGGGTFTLPPNTPGGASFSLPVANMPAGSASQTAGKKSAPGPKGSKGGAKGGTKGVTKGGSKGGTNGSKGGAKGGSKGGAKKGQSRKGGR